MKTLLFLLVAIYLYSGYVLYQVIYEKRNKDEGFVFVFVLFFTLISAFLFSCLLAILLYFFITYLP